MLAAEALVKTYRTLSQTIAPLKNWLACGLAHSKQLELSSLDLPTSPSPNLQESISQLGFFTRSKSDTPVILTEASQRQVDVIDNGHIDAIRDRTTNKPLFSEEGEERVEANSQALLIDGSTQTAIRWLESSAPGDPFTVIEKLSKNEYRTQ